MSNLSPALSGNRSATHQANFSKSSIIVNNPGNQPSLSGLRKRTPQGNSSGRRRPPPPPPIPVPQTTQKNVIMTPPSEDNPRMKQPECKNIMQPPPVTKILAADRCVARKLPPKPQKFMDGTLQTIQRPLHNISPPPSITSSQPTVRNDLGKNTGLESKTKDATAKPKLPNSSAEPRDGNARSQPDHVTAESQTKALLITQDNSLHSRMKSVQFEPTQRGGVTEFKQHDSSTKFQTQSDKLKAIPNIKSKPADKHTSAILPNYALHLLAYKNATLPHSHNLLSSASLAPVTASTDPVQQMLSRRHVRGPKPAPPVRYSSLGRDCIHLPFSPSVTHQQSLPKSLDTPDDMSNSMRSHPSESKVAVKKFLSTGDASNEYEQLMLATCDDIPSAFALPEVTDGSGMDSTATMTSSEVMEEKSSSFEDDSHEYTPLTLLGTNNDSTSVYALPQLIGDAGKSRAATIAQRKPKDDSYSSSGNSSNQYQMLTFATRDDTCIYMKCSRLTGAAGVGSAATMANTGDKQQFKSSSPPLMMSWTSADNPDRTARMSKSRTLLSPRPQPRACNAYFAIKSHPQSCVVATIKTKKLPSQLPPSKLSSSIEEREYDKKEWPLHPSPPKLNKLSNRSEQQATPIAKPRKKVQMSSNDK